MWHCKRGKKSFLSKQWKAGENPSCACGEVLLSGDCLWSLHHPRSCNVNQDLGLRWEALSLAEIREGNRAMSHTVAPTLHSRPSPDVSHKKGLVGGLVAPFIWRTYQEVRRKGTSRAAWPSPLAFTSLFFWGSKGQSIDSDARFLSSSFFFLSFLLSLSLCLSLVGCLCFGSQN